MLGYMNEEALKISQSSGFATFLVEQDNVFGQKEKPQGTNWQSRKFFMTATMIRS